MTAYVLEQSVTYDQQAVDPPKFSPIQMVEFLRKSLCEVELAVITTAMRQLRVGIFHPHLR